MEEQYKNYDFGLAGSGIQLVNGKVVVPNAQNYYFDNTSTVANTEVPSVKIDTPSYLTNTDGGSNASWTDTVAKWFTPGEGGTSVGGNLMQAVGDGVNAATGLAGLYFSKKNYDLQKDQQEYLKNREAQSDARKSQFAANAGGTY